MKLNLQQENLLSKEERKEVLGGVEGCYVLCSTENRKPIPDCSSERTKAACGYNTVLSCYCPS